MKIAMFTLAAAALLTANAALAQAKEQFFPSLVYRTWKL